MGVFFIKPLEKFEYQEPLRTITETSTEFNFVPNHSSLYSELSHDLFYSRNYKTDFCGKARYIDIHIIGKLPFERRATDC